MLIKEVVLALQADALSAPIGMLFIGSLLNCFIRKKTCSCALLGNRGQEVDNQESGSVKCVELC